MAVYEYLPVRNIAGRKHGGEAVVKGMFRIPEPGETSQEMKSTRLALTRSKWPVHKIVIEQAELQEKELIEKKIIYMLASVTAEGIPPSVYTTKNRLVKESG